MTAPTPDWYWARPLQLVAGRYPATWGRAGTEARLAALLDAGVRSFLDLTERHELEPYDPALQELAASRGLDVRYRRMSIVDHGIPTIDHMREILEYVAGEIDGGRPVYVHCWGGIGRTGTVVGCWMTRQEGLTAGEAIARIGELRRATPGCFGPSPETDEQCEFIAIWEAAQKASRSDP